MLQIRGPQFGKINSWFSRGLIFEYFLKHFSKLHITPWRNAKEFNENTFPFSKGFFGCMGLGRMLVSLDRWMTTVLDDVLVTNLMTFTHFSGYTSTFFPKHGPH